MALVTKIGDLNADAEIAVIFIHGLGGSASTWESFTSKLNEKWNRNTPIDLLYPVYTPNEKKWLLFKMDRGPEINRLSGFIKNYIKNNCRNHKYIILVGHSMGGLVARRYVINEIDNEDFKVTDLITYATPHKGSRIAIYSFLLIVPLFMPQIRQLSVVSSFISKLNTEWTQKEIYLRIKFLTIAAGRDWIVRLSSAVHYENDKTIHEDPGKSHFTILKPVDMNDISLSMLNTLIEDRIESIVSDVNNIDENDFELEEDKSPY